MCASMSRNRRGVLVQAAAAAILVAGLSVSAVEAGSIGLNISAPNLHTISPVDGSDVYDYTISPSTSLLPSEVAGVTAVAQSHWNNIAGSLDYPLASYPAGSPAGVQNGYWPDNEAAINSNLYTITNSDGTTVPGMSVNWSYSANWRNQKMASWGFGGTNLTLMSGGVMAPASTGSTITVTGIPYASYDVYAYFSGGGNPGSGGGTATLSLPAGTSGTVNTTPGAYTFGWFSGAFSLNGNYAVISGNSATAFTLTHAATNWTGLCAIQIVDTTTSQPGAWALPGSGDWNTARNWGGQTIPNAVGAPVSFLSPLSANTNVNVDTAVTAGSLTINQATSSVVLSGMGSLTLQAATGSNAQINVQQGNHVIQTRGTILASNTDISVASGSSLAIQSPLTMNSGVSATKQGAGTLSIESYQTYKGSNTLNVQAGTVNFKVPASGLTVNNSGGTINFSAAQSSVAALSVSAGSAVVSGGMLTTGSLNVGSSGKLDVGANKVIVRGGNVANIEAQLAAGRNVAAGGIGDGSWDGTHGIVSSAAAAAYASDGIESRAVGLGVSGQMPMGDPVVPGTSTPVFSGAANNDVLLRCTYNGDATLDGVVDDFDVIVVGALYDAGASTGHHWYEGDFNGDGKIDDSDVILLGAFYAPTAPVLSDASLTQTYGAEFAKAFEAGRALAVPEPATLSLLGLGALGLLGRQRRNMR